MKNKVFTIIAILNIANLYAQNNISNYIEEGINLLGKNVPLDYMRINRTMYQKDYDDISIILDVEDNVIVDVTLGYAFLTDDRASRWTALFFQYFEKNNWTYHRRIYQFDEIYYKDSVFVVICHPYTRGDGQTLSKIIFSYDIRRLYG
jgi:hypothetical protein